MDNLNGLENLTKVDGNLTFSENYLQDISALQNLKTVGGLLTFQSNPYINDISALNSVESVGDIRFHNKTYDVKMSADSYICQNYESFLSSSYAEKSKVCE